MSYEDHKKALIDLKRSLLEAQQTGEEAEQTVELDQARVGRLSRMDALQAQAMSKESGRRRRQKLLQVEAALGRIENDEFGYCHECGDEIAAARLNVDPTITLCIRCAQARES